MALMLAFLLSAVPQEDPALTQMPEGWVTGKKSGWDGDYPPEWEKKTDEEKQAFLKQWNQAKFRYIKFMQNAKGNPTPPVAGAELMLKAVNAGLKIPQVLDLAMYGQNLKLKEPDFKMMLKSASAVHGTEVPHHEAVVIVKDLITAGLKGAELEKRARAEIAKKDKALQEAKAKKEKEEQEKKDKK
jgi:hypothetical protein